MGQLHASCTVHARLYLDQQTNLLVMTRVLTVSMGCVARADVDDEAAPIMASVHRPDPPKYDFIP